MGVDISGRKRAETALQESEQRFNAFMDATPAIAWITDYMAGIKDTDRAWDEAFGLTGESGSARRLSTWCRRRRRTNSTE